MLSRAAQHVVIWWFWNIQVSPVSLLQLKIASVSLPELLMFENSNMRLL